MEHTLLATRNLSVQVKMAAVGGERSKVCGNAAHCSGIAEGGGRLADPKAVVVGIERALEVGVAGEAELQDEWRIGGLACCQRRSHDGGGHEGSESSGELHGG